jgi:tetraacyldisaccharide 4'-kinase
LLSPLSALYWLITTVRNWCYDVGVFKSTSFDIPIISVGNLAVGGSGKTPMVEYLIRELKSEYKIATLSRGYGRKTKGFLWVEPNLSANLTGDEPLQIKTKFKDISVAVCEDRVAGVQRILAEKPEIDLILLDDAFQHRAIKPSTQLLLSTYARPFYTDYLMPSGRLRERRSGALRTDAIIFTKCPTDYEKRGWRDKPIFYSKIVYEKLPISGPIYGFSALANNSVFEQHLAENYDLKGFTGFADHHLFTQSDVDMLLKNAEGASLVCTEKDWVKTKDLKGAESIKHISISNILEGEQDFLDWLKSHIHLEWAFNNIGSKSIK